MHSQWIGVRWLTCASSSIVLVIANRLGSFFIFTLSEYVLYPDFHVSFFFLFICHVKILEFFDDIISIFLFVFFCLTDDFNFEAKTMPHTEFLLLELIFILLESVDSLISSSLRAIMALHAEGYNDRWQQHDGHSKIHHDNGWEQFYFPPPRNCCTHSKIHKIFRII